MPARLKVYAARLGFFDTVVAVASQKAALAAWGVHRDLFKDGAAGPTDEAEAQAALQHPGVVLRRPAGSDGPYTEGAEAEAPPPATGPRSAKPKPKTPPDRRPVERAQAGLAEAATRHEAEAADLHKQLAALESERADMEASWRERRAALEAELEMARDAYRKAGGRL